jgi:hypothetical protein
MGFVVKQFQGQSRLRADILSRIMFLDSSSQVACKTDVKFMVFQT